MPRYKQKQRSINAQQYRPGAEDDFDIYTSATISTKPIPANLIETALYWITKTGNPPNAWTCSIPFITTAGQRVYLKPTDYIITGTGGAKERKTKEDFEAEYDPDNAG